MVVKGRRMDENTRKAMQRKKKFNQQKTGVKFIPETEERRDYTLNSNLTFSEM